MARPVNGKPAWLIERLKERPTDGVPEFVDTYLRMKYGADDIARIKAGYECKHTPVLWVNPAACTVDQAQAALAEAGIATAPHAWCPGVLEVAEEDLARFADSDLAAQGNVRVLDDPTALLVAEMTAQAANELADAREAEAAAQAAAEAEQAAAAEAAQIDGEAQQRDGSEQAAQAAQAVATEQAAQAADSEQASGQAGEADAADKPDPAAAAEQAAPAASAKQADAADPMGTAGDNADSQVVDATQEETPELVSVAELCAGTGGMTLPLSAAVRKGVLIHACEVSSSEYDQLTAALEAANATNVDAQRYDSRRFRGDEHAFDIILLDPPCTPTGTLYAHDPHLHAQFPENKVIECMSLAKSLFLLSLSMLNVGGTLIYTTTSVLHLENEEILRTCLARSGSMGTFEIEPVELPANANLPKLPVSAEGTVLTCPSKACPGRFIAKIRRTA